MTKELIESTSHPAVSQPARRFVILSHAVLFVLGFSVIFVVGWGGAATFAGQIFSDYKRELAQIGGVVVILFGIANLGILRLPWLYYDTRPQWDGSRGSGFLSSTLMGVFFAAGWTPCIGTTLGAILMMGFSQETAAQAMLLSSGYALGLGIPFLLIGVGVDRAAHVVHRFRRHVRKVQIASGLLLIGIGVMLLTDQLTLIAIWAQRNGLFLDVPLGGASTPTYLIAVLAGLVSFLSPCVLPLVPAYVGYLTGRTARMTDA
jgi:cytochrome c-type biogenesis protein